ncbi:MAG: A/G-specific adenine glycosylase [Flavobacteriales bacterium]|nr:A/G-specific adenine glycosylase [Flavobacteriales bacterium]
MFAARLLEWYHLNKRDLPWRETKNPYKIWLSEIILQQTRVAQGRSYYLKFIAHYPTVNDLAKASEEEVLKDWQGLGYYSRARNLHSTAKYISNELNNVFPNSHQEIKQLRGVGDYTSAAIASFAFDLPYAVVDGNVYRILSRIFGIETPIDSTLGKKEFATLAQSLLTEDQPANFNQAMMEFGAIQCTPKKPNCMVCPFSEHCYALSENAIKQLPIKEKKLKQKTKYLNYFIFETEDTIIINKRDKKGIWQNLYDFPLIESKKELNEEQITQSTAFAKLINQQEYKVIAVSAIRKHILSHQILMAKFIHLRLKDEKSLKKIGFEGIKKEELIKRPIPKLIENYLNEESNLLSLFTS